MRFDPRLAAAAAAVLIGAAGSAGANPPENARPTCADLMGIDVHGQHVVGDYVTGLGHELEWSPGGGGVGEAVADNGGAYLPGGPGPSFHFEFGFAPGASFCNDSRSPGLHP